MVVVVVATAVAAVVGKALVAANEPFLIMGTKFRLSFEWKNALERQLENELENRKQIDRH